MSIVSQDPQSQIAAPQKAVRAIQDRIRCGEFSPGARLPAQRELAQNLNVSRASLREALSTLEALGFVRTEAGRGTFVTIEGADEPLSAEMWRFAREFDISEVYEFRYFIEASAIRLAAREVTDEELEEFHQLHELYKAAIHSFDLVRSGELDYRFHQMIMICSRNRVYEMLYDRFESVFQQSQLLPFSRHEKLWEPVAEHGKILEALERRDPDGAAYYLQMHMVRAAERVGVPLRRL